MKRVLLTAIIMMIVSLNVLEAQGVCFGIKAGLNLEDITGLVAAGNPPGSITNENTKLTFGFHAGILADIWLSDHWSLVPEALWTTAGAQESVTRIINGNTYTAVGPFSLNYLQIPVFVEYKFNSGIYLEGGPYVAILVAKNLTRPIVDDNGNAQTEVVGADSTTNRVDVGVGLGVGYRFCMGLGFNLRYDLGLTAVEKQHANGENAGITYNTPAYGKNGVLQLSVSYLFGCNRCNQPAKAVAEVAPAPAPAPPPAPVPEKQVEFTVNAPSSVPSQHTVIENIPLRDYVFFDAGSAAIPPRYVQLSSDQASGFAESQLQNCQKDPGTQASRTMTVYHNILNIVGDRMRKYPNSTIKLIGSSGGNGTAAGKANAQSVKDYLVNNFGIASKRIAVEGRNQPMIQSEQAYNQHDMALTKVEDNRVDIVSTSTDLMMEVKGNSALCLKPIDVTTMDGSSTDDAPVIVNVSGANELLDSWSVDIKDPKGNSQHFGPYTSEKESLSGRAILDGNPGGTYTMTMTGQSKSGHPVTMETTFPLTRKDGGTATEQRYNILFEFDKSTTVATYQNFLSSYVAPIIPDNSTVVITGHTDIVGDETYNMNLSNDRANEAKTILKSITDKASKTVTYQTKGYGIGSPIFENTTPEERFYNRMVEIDIIPAELISIGAR